MHTEILSGGRTRRLAGWMLTLAALAGLASMAPAAQAQSNGPVPPATRFCAKGGDPSLPGNGADPRGVNPASANPLAGLDLYVNKIQDPAYADLQAYRRSGQKAKADAIAPVALTPKAVWFGRFTAPNFQGKVRDHINCAQALQPGSVPIMTVLRAQAKQCNSHYTAGGVAEDNLTKKWYRDFAQAVGNARVIIAFEPDSIGTISCLAKSRRRARMDLLRYGVDVLSKLPRATIYLEGTASDWKSPAFTAKMLRYIGVAKVRGFMLNVTHFDWTVNNIAYGRKVSNRIGGKPFVVSTSYNGRGSVHYKQGKRQVNVFCNVRYRGTGPSPNTRTGFAKVDGFLWLNRPGISAAGKCNGAPSTQWWPARGLMYGEYGTQWLAPPKGTNFGFPQRISLCRLGAPRANGKYYTSAPESRCR